MQMRQASFSNVSTLVNAEESPECLVHFIGHIATVCVTVFVSLMERSITLVRKSESLSGRPGFEYICCHFEGKFVNSTLPQLAI